MVYRSFYIEENSLKLRKYISNFPRIVKSINY